MQTTCTLRLTREQFIWLGLDEAGYRYASVGDYVVVCVSEDEHRDFQLQLADRQDSVAPEANGASELYGRRRFSGD